MTQLTLPQVRPGKDNAKEEVDDDAARHARALTGRFQRFCSFAETLKEIQFLSEDTKLLKYLSSFCTFISKSDWAPHADQLVDMCDRQIIGLDLFTLARTLAACQHREGNLLREAEVSLGRRRLCFACRACGVSPWGRYRSPHRRCMPERAAKAPGRTGPPPAPSTAAA